MKKLIAMIGAAAMSFGLFAEGVLNHVIDFQPPAFTVGQTISNNTEDAEAVFGWYLPEGASEESGTVAADGDNQYLAIETDAGKPLARTFAAKETSIAAPTAVDIDTGLFLDTKVKFTLGEEQPTVGDGTKLIIWAKETEADTDVAAATNLMVVAGQVDDSTLAVTPANFTLALADNFDFSAWHRVTVRAIKDVTADSCVAGFAIFIDGVQVAAADADYADKVGLSDGKMTSEAKKFYAAKQLFLSCVKADDLNAQKLTYTGFDGAGSIDDLALCDKDGAKTICNFAIGEIVFRLTYDPEVIDSWECYVGDTKITTIVDDGEGTADITLDGSVETISIKNIVVKNPTTTDVTDPQNFATADEIGAIAATVNVAIFNGQKYPTLAAALDAAQGQTGAVELLSDCELSDEGGNAYEVANDLTIDLKGNVLTVNIDGEFGIEVKANLTVIDTIGDGSIAMADGLEGALLYVSEGSFILGNGTDAGATIDGMIGIEGTADLKNGKINATLNESIDPSWIDEDSECSAEPVDGYWVITPVLSKPFAVIIAGVTTEYKTLQAAFDATVGAESAATIKLTDDAAGNGTLVMGAQNVILDLNDFELTGNITVTADTTAEYPITNFTIKNGTIVGDITMTNDRITIAKDATVEGSVVLNNVNEATVQGAIDNEDGTAITLNSGTLKISNTAVIDAATAIDAKAGKVQVSSNSSTSKAQIGGAISAGEGVTTAINGGEYTTDISAMLADDRVAVKGEDGKWTVVPTVAKIGTSKFDSLAKAFAAAQDDDEIVLVKNAELDGCISVAKKVTLNIGTFNVTPKADAIDNKKFTTGFTKDALFAVNYGGDFAVVGTTGTIGSGDIYSAIKMTEKNEVQGDKAKAKLTVAANVKGCYYGICGNGGRPGTEVVVNSGTIEGTCVDDSVGIFNPQGASTLKINGGTIRGAVGVWIKSGACEFAVDSGAIIEGIGSKAAYQGTGDGFHNTGDALVVDNAGYPGGAPAPAIHGGIFRSTYGSPIASYARTDDYPELAPVVGFVDGGNFSGAISGDLFAEGFELGEYNPSTGLYSVAQSKGFIIRVAGIDAAAVTEDDTSFTVATTEKPLVYIAGQAATVEGTAGAWTVAKPEITADTCVSFVKDQAIAAPAQKWYESPKRVGIMWYDQEKHTGYGSNDYTGLASSFDGLYVGLAYGSNNTESYLGNVANIIDGDTTNIYAYQDNNRGNCVSKEWGVMLVGTAGAENKLRAWNLNENSKIATVTLKAEGYDSFSGDSIAIIGNKLWVNGYAGANNKAIYRFTIPASGFVDGLELTAEAVVTAAEQIRNFRVYEVGGKFIVYAKADAAFYVGTMEDGLVKKDDFNTNDKGRYCDVAVAGSHLYIFNAYTADVEMYDIDTTTGWFASEAVPTKISMLEVCGQPSWTSDKAGRGSSIFVTPDETTLVHCGYYGVSAVQYLPPPTFSIQLVKATETHEGNVYTFAPAEGYEMSSVFANGAAVADAELVKNVDGTWTWTPTAETGDFDVVAAAKKPRATVEHKWYESPKAYATYTLKNCSSVGHSAQGFYRWGKGNDESYFGAIAAHGNPGGGVMSFDIAAVEAAEGALTTAWGDVKNATYFDKLSLTGVGVSEAQGVALFGNRQYEEQGKTYGEACFISMPLSTEGGVDPVEGVNVFRIYADQERFIPNHVAISADNRYVYASPDESTTLYKYEIVGSLKKEGVALKFLGKYENCVASEIRNMTYANIDGVDYVFISDRGTVKVLDCSSFDNDAQAIGVTYYEKGALAVAGIKNGTPRLYVVDADNEEQYIRVYDLAINSGVMTATLDTNCVIARADAVAFCGGTAWAAGSGKSSGLVVTDDEKTLVLGSHNIRGTDTIFAIKYVPQYTVTFVDDKATPPAAQKVFEGELATDPQYAPTVEGFTFKGWFAPDAETAFDFATPITADLTLTAKWEEVQTWPEAWDTPEFKALTDEEKKAYGDKFKTWKGSFAGEITPAMLNNFLLGVAPDATLPELKIDSITVEGDKATIVVSAGETDLSKANGVLFVSGTDDLAGEWTTTEVAMPTGDVGTTATFVVEKAKFMKAKVGFKAETPVNE